VAKGESEVYRPADACRIAEVAPYVLRYWETEFPMLSEGKDKGATKFYTARDVKIIARIRELLYDEGFTVAGAKKRLEAEIAEGRFDDGLAAARPPAEQRGKAPTPLSRSSDQASRKVAPASPPPAPAVPPPAPVAPPAAAAPDGYDRKRVVRELKEIVKILESRRKD
jgi:DNA-binding transcriptional MerR regulator